MKAMRFLVVAAMGIFVCGSFARAATPIEFEFGGVFTQTTGTVFQVGSPFTTTVRFDPATPDTNPSADTGRYTYISWTAPYRTATPIVLVPPSGAIEILVGGGGQSHGWYIKYFGAGQFGFELDVDYPPGSFVNDALPPTLDLSLATATRFLAVDASVGVDVRGTINSFRVVPEPGFSGGILLGALLVRLDGRRLQRQVRPLRREGHISAGGPSENGCALR